MQAMSPLLRALDGRCCFHMLEARLPSISGGRTVGVYIDVGMPERLAGEE